MKSLSPRAVTSAQPLHTSRQASPTGLVSSAVALALLTALVLFSGCATTPQQRAAKTLVSIVQTVDVAMKGFATADALGQVSAHDQTQVRKLYADYQVAVELAGYVIKTAIQSGDTSNLAAATAAADARRDELLLFLSRFTTSPP